MHSTEKPSSRYYEEWNCIDIGLRSCKLYDAYYLRLGLKTCFSQKHLDCIYNYCTGNIEISISRYRTVGCYKSAFSADYHSHILLFSTSR